MPIVTFEAGQIDSEVKRQLIQRLTEVSTEVTGIPRELFFVVIRELPDDDIAVGGRTVTQIKAGLAITETAN